MDGLKGKDEVLTSSFLALFVCHDALDAVLKKIFFILKREWHAFSIRTARVHSV